jgi:hypothetical protein
MSRIPFVRRAYDGSQSSARLSDMIRYRGSREADAIREQGNISAHMWSGIGNNIANVTGQIAQAIGDRPAREAQAAAASVAKRSVDDDRQIREAGRLLINPETGELDTKALAREATYIDPIKGLEWWKVAKEEEKAKFAQAHELSKEIAKTAGFILTMPPPLRPEAYAAKRPEFAQRFGIPLESIPEQYDEQFLKEKVHEAKTFEQVVQEMGALAKQEAEGDYSLPPDHVRFNRNNEKVAENPRAPEPPKAPPLGSFEDYVGRSFGPNPTPEQITDARQRYGNADNDPTLRAVRELTLQSAQTKAGTLPPSQQRRVNALADQFKADPAVKRATVIGEAVNFVQSLDPNSQSPADDQALIYAFAKAMDPESVVREGEYATVQKYAQSWIQNMGFNAARVLSNSEFLSDSARKNMKATIQQKFDASRKSYDNARTEYAKQIDRVTGTNDGVEHLIDYAGAFPKATNQPPPPPPPGNAAPTPQRKVGDIVPFQGKQYRIKAIVNGEAVLVEVK